MTATSPTPGDAPAEQLRTVLDLVRYAASRFSAAGLAFGHGTDNAIDEAIFLVCEALSLPSERIDAMLPARLLPSERRRVLELVEKRIATRMPAPYLVGKAYVRSVPFISDPRAIVPRSYIAELLDGGVFADPQLALIADPAQVRRVLDLCTGSGYLAVMACWAFPEAVVDAVDLSAEALEVAQANAELHHLTGRVRLFAGDLFAPVGSARYDIILANPPYVDEAAMGALPPEYRHEPALALAAGVDGLDVVRRILAEAGNHIAEGGGLLCEIGRTRPALEQAEPERPFLWLDTAQSAGEVFWLPAAALR